MNVSVPLFIDTYYVPPPGGSKACKECAQYPRVIDSPH